MVDVADTPDPGGEQAQPSPAVTGAGVQSVKYAKGQTPESLQAGREAADLAKTGMMPPRSLATGIPFIGPYLDEAAAGVTALPNLVTGGAIGPTYTQALERLRANERHSDEQYPIANTLGPIAAGVVTGGPISRCC